MKNSKRFAVSPKNKRTHVKQPGPGRAPFKVPEYGPFATVEEAEAAGRAAKEIAAKMGFKCTVTTIEVSDKTDEV